jgi:hypothetical protein
MICVNCLDHTKATYITQQSNYTPETEYYRGTVCCGEDVVYYVDNEHYDLFVRFMRRFGTHPTQISTKEKL